MSWITPVYDRTTAVQYTSTDLNRVGEDVAYLANLFNTYGYSVAVTPKTDWSKDSIPNMMQATAYLANVQTLINAFYTLPSTPSLPSSMSKLNYSKANDIEKILFDLKCLLENMISEFKCAGTFYAGQEIIL
jgi:uncharacterized membrane protein